MRDLGIRLTELIYGENPNCMVCKEDAVHMQFGLCQKCFEAFPFAERPLIAKSLSVARYEPPVKQLVYDYKYNDQRYLGRNMAFMMAALVKSE